MKIVLKPIGNVDNQVLEELRKILGRTFGCPVEIASYLDIPNRAYNKGRGQYLATALLDLLKAAGVAPNEKVLGIVDVDLYAAGEKFVFGWADDIPSDVAVISLSRLKQELPPDYNKFAERAAKEAIHELGHTFGLGHCTKAKCVMHFSSTLHDTDVKGMFFCSQCPPKLIQ